MWTAFLHYLIRTRDIGSVLASGTQFAYSVLPSLKRAYPYLRVTDVLHNASPLGHIKSSVRFTAEIDHHVVVASTIAQALAESEVPPSKIHVIHNGVDTDLFEPTRYRHADSMREWGLEDGRPVISFIGRLYEEKQPLEFLALAAALADTPAQFMLIGDGPEHDAVEARLRRSDLRERVLWHKHVPPECIPSVLAATSALAITSSTEGFPMVMLEALAMEVPVFTYDVGDVRAAITDGLNGHVIEAGSFEAMVATLRRFIADPGEQLTLRTSARPSLLKQGFTLPEMQRAYASLLLTQTRV
jgi:glycosyltransferase involved in cell wall biosynthesis